MTKLISLTILIVSIFFIMNEIYTVQCVGGQFPGMASILMRQRMRSAKRSHHDDFDTNNHCILSCVKCSNGELENIVETVNNIFK